MVQPIEGNEKLTEFSTKCSLQSRAIYICRPVAIGNSSAPFHLENTVFIDVFKMNVNVRIVIDRPV
jgi:hypothetical protein